MRMTFTIAICLWTSSFVAADDRVLDLATVDRTIAREPAYTGLPHYALLIFGPRAKQRAWLVIDGDSVAYIDRNGNGDLTDAEDRVELDAEATQKIRLGNPGAYKALHVFTLGELYGHQLTFQLWVRNPDFDASQNDLYRDLFQEYDANQWVNGTLLRKGPDLIQAQNPLLLTVRRAAAQVSHFGGPLTFALDSRERQTLEAWPKRTTLEVNIGCRNLLAKDCRREAFGFTVLTTSEVPADMHPVATLEYPGLLAEGKPMVQTIQLDQRCCGNRFYGSLNLPKDFTGSAVKVTLVYPTNDKLQVAPAEFLVPVNRKLSKYNEQIFVMFRDPKIDLKQAVNVLRKRGFDVSIENEGLLVQLDGDLRLVVRLVRDSEVSETAAALGKDPDDVQALRQCDARFEIMSTDWEKLLKEPKMLGDVQTALQSLTHGYIYTTWDQQLAGPK